MPAPDDTAAPFGSFEWAKQIVTDANTAWEAERMAMSKPIEGSPQLDEPLRSRERAALDIAVKALTQIQDWNQANPAGFGTAAWASLALDKIAALIPEAVNPDIHGERERNTDRMP